MTGVLLLGNVVAMLRRLVLVTPLVSWFACASVPVPQGKPLYAFPTQHDLDKVAAQASPHASERPAASPALGWDMDTAVAPEAEQQALHALTQEFIARTGSHASQPLACVAHELARAVANDSEHLPAHTVRRFIGARCGSAIAIPALRSWVVDVAAEADTLQVMEKFRPQLVATEAQHGRAGQLVGLGVARVEKRIAIVAAGGEPQVELEQFSPMADAHGRVVIRGRLKQSVARIAGYVNRDAQGIAPCTVDPARALPEFSLSCELAPGDDHAWLEIVVTPEGAVARDSVLQVIALRRPDAARSYAAPSSSEQREVADAAAFPRVMLEELNRVRRQQGLPALVLAEAESALAAQLAGPFFDSYWGQTPGAGELSATITNGLLAGWSVKGGTIQSADFLMNMAEGADGARRWLASALELPFGRATLLDPRGSAIALGAHTDHAGAAGVAVVYRFADAKQSEAAMVAAVLQRLTDLRKARKAGDTSFVPGAPGMDTAVARVRQQGRAPASSLQAVLRRMANAWNQPAIGYVRETAELDQLELPPDLLNRGDLSLSIGVTQYRPPGSAWAQYAVLFAVMGNTPTGGCTSQVRGGMPGHNGQCFLP